MKKFFGIEESSALTSSPKMKRIEMFQLPVGMRLLPDEQIELAFEYSEKRHNKYVIFTNRRLISNAHILLNRTTYEILVYQHITRYTFDVKSHKISLGVVDDTGIDISREFKFSENDLLEVEYVLAKNICR